MTRVIPRICAWLLVCLYCVPTARCETFQCTQKIEAFDVNQPDRLVGYFEPPTSLEIEAFVPDAKMYRVLFKAPNGSEVRALCRPESLGKKAPDSTDKPPTTATTSSPEPEEAPARDKPATRPTGKASNPPPVFVSIKQFEGSLWETPSSKFALLQSSFGFKWVSLAENNESRCGNPLFFLDQPVVETIARFQSDHLSEVRLLMFGRGDSRTEMDEESYLQTIKTLESQLNNWTGGKGLDAWVQGNAADTKRKSWFKFPLRVDLESSFTRNAKESSGFDNRTIRFRTEFIRIVMTSYDGKTDAAQLVKPNFQSGQATATVRKADLKERVKKEGSGDVYLDGVPMVDQGQKGYCVVASMERVMRFYGIDVDQNEMAKAANTMTSGGTSPDAMFKALKKLGGQFSMTVREHIGFDIQDFFKEVESYNHVAKKNKVSEVRVPRVGMINISEAYESMDTATLREVRLKRANDKTKFTRDVSDLIDKGSPVFWGVQIGLVDEIPALPQAKGGHMRLIIGYNTKTSEIIYTDSWGAGHELKRMPVDDAFFITSSLYSVTPGS